MRVALIVASLCALVVCGGVQAAADKPKPGHSRKLGLTIRVEGGGWGAAGNAQIETVLYAVADQLLPRLPQKLAAPIIVTHTEHNPVALYERGRNGEYLVQLHASGARWYLYAYEFAHELCHLISNYDEHLPADRRRDNQWFEETICETASLYTLKSLAAAWQTAPPAPEWAKEAEHLRRYYDLLVNENHRRLPPGTALAAWLAPQEAQLRGDPYQRKKNQLVANHLLPLFEDALENWEVLGYLNLEPADARVGLRDYLRRWYQRVPTRHKRLVAGVLGLLDALDEETPVASAAAAGEEGGSR